MPTGRGHALSGIKQGGVGQGTCPLRYKAGWHRAVPTGRGHALSDVKQGGIRQCPQAGGMPSPV